MLGACVAHADQLESKLRFAKQLGFLEADEDGYFQKAFKELKVSENDYMEVTLHPVTKAFQELMYSAVSSSDYAHLFGHAGHCRRSLFRLGFQRFGST